VQCLIIVWSRCLEGEFYRVVGGMGENILEKKQYNIKICFNIETMGFSIPYFEIIKDVIQNPC